MLVCCFFGKYRYCRMLWCELYCYKRNILMVFPLTFFHKCLVFTLGISEPVGYHCSTRKQNSVDIIIMLKLSLDSLRMIHGNIPDTFKGCSVSKNTMKIEQN